MSLLLCFLAPFHYLAITVESATTWLVCVSVGQEVIQIEVAVTTDIIQSAYFDYSDQSVTS